MTDVKFEGEIHKYKDGIVAKFDRMNDAAEEHDHKCRPFKSDGAAETWLLDQGVDLEDIERTDHTTPEHKEEGMAAMADMLGEVAKGITERLETVNRLKSLAPNSGYDFDDIKHLESDALQVMVILAKYGMPIHPEALEGKLSESANARG
jgi:hypothetical protein